MSTPDTVRSPSSDPIVLSVRGALPAPNWSPTTATPGQQRQAILRQRWTRDLALAVERMEALAAAEQAQRSSALSLIAMRARASARS